MLKHQTRTGGVCAWQDDMRLTRKETLGKRSVTSIRRIFVRISYGTYVGRENIKWLDMSVDFTGFADDDP